MVYEIKEELAVLIMFVLVALVCAVVFLSLSHEKTVYPFTFPFETEATLEDTGSMKPTLTKYDKAIMEKANSSERLSLGHVYVYEKGNLSVIHRLIECADENYILHAGDKVSCRRLVFKGDNNRKGEIVLRGDVSYLVTGARYG